MDDEDEDEENMGFIELDNGMVIFKKLVERLFPHQVMAPNAYSFEFIFYLLILHTLLAKSESS